MKRRRFLTIAAALLACPAGASEADFVWTGTGFGGALSLRLSGLAPAQAPRLTHRITQEVARLEGLFSLFRDSALTRLNRDGHLAGPPPDLLALLRLARQVHAATDGAFDPSVQPLWQAIATGGDSAAARGRVGLSQLRLSDREIRLGPGQALTLNGIAQGWAADRIAGLLRDAGFGPALIDMGEIAAVGPRPDGTPWQVALAGPEGQVLGGARLEDRALATSAPRGTLIGAERQPHILGPQGQSPLWRTVSVSAPSAALADALSTAFCLMPRARIDRALTAFPGTRLELLV